MNAFHFLAYPRAYVFQAELICDHCADKARRTAEREGRAPADPDDESSYDSDDYPKGPVPNGGGEADTPQHCGYCGVFLENPLTPEGGEYVRQAAREFETPGADESWEDIARTAEAAGDNGPTVAEWIRFYLAPGQ